MTIDLNFIKDYCKTRDSHCTDCVFVNRGLTRYCALQETPLEWNIDFIKQAYSKIAEVKKCPNCDETAGTYSLGEACKSCHCEV